MSNAEQEASSGSSRKRLLLIVSLAILTATVVSTVVIVFMRSDRLPAGEGMVKGERTQFSPIRTGPAGADLSAPSTPRPGLVEAVSTNGSAPTTPVKSMHTGKDGKFHLVLPAGTYRIAGGQDGCLEQTVMVTAGKSAYVTLVCGTN